METKDIILYGYSPITEQDFIDILLIYINRNMRHQFKKSLVISEDPDELGSGLFCITCRLDDKISRAYLPINPYWKMLKNVPEIYDERPMKNSSLQIVSMPDIIREYDSKIEIPTRRAN